MLAPSYASATAYNRQLALANQGGIFGNVVQTFNDWIAKLWELHGTGQALVSPLQREALAQLVIQQSSLNHLQSSPNLAAALAKIASRAVGVPWISQARQAGPEAFSPAECELLDCMDDYQARLAAYGWVEQGQILASLIEHASDVFNNEPVSVYVLDSTPLSQHQQWFFEACQSYIQLHHEVREPEAMKRIPETKELRFAFPSGGYAQAQVVFQAIQDAVRDAAKDGLATKDSEQAPQANPVVVVAARHPLELYAALAEPSEQAGITCAVRGNKPFAQTDFGTLFLSARAVLAGSDLPWDKAALSSVLHSPYVGLKKYTVWAWDEYLRSDRLLPRNQVLEWLEHGVPEDNPASRTLRGGYANFTLVMNYAANPFDMQLLEALRERTYQMMQLGVVDTGFTYDALAALDVLTATAEVVEEVAARVGDSLGSSQKITMFELLLQNTRVSAARSTQATAAGVQPQVLICDQHMASKLAPESIHTLVLCDLTTQAYPVNDRLDAADALLQRLGATRPELALARERRRFGLLLQVPYKRVVLERTLNSPTADSLYPCAMLEELTDAYRSPEDIGLGEDIDNIYRLPSSLQAAIAYEQGEDNLLENVQPGLAQLLSVETSDNPCERGTIRTDVAQANVLYPYAESQSSPTLVLSPTAIDAYRDCPYKWLVQRRLHTEAPDEDFGPLSIGTFQHMVMQEFYERFPGKVTPDTLDEAYRLMFGSAAQDGTSIDLSGGSNSEEANDGLFAQVVAKQASLDPNNRYAAMPNTTETFEYNSLRELASEWLSFESEFLPSYRPHAFELRLEDAHFGGCVFNGFIDRLDIDPATGNAVVIDYKGSLKTQYRPLATHYREVLGWKEDGYVQAVLYAAILNKAIAEHGPLMVPTGSGWKYNVESGTFARMYDEPVNELEQAAAPLGAAPAAPEAIPVNAVVGALYLSYGHGNGVVGAFDSEAVPTEQIPTLDMPQAARLAHNGDYTFEGYLQEVELLVQDAVARMHAGLFSPAPASSDACTYCPVFTCEKRGGGDEE